MLGQVQQPVILHWLGAILSGDLGVSLSSGKPVRALIAGNIETTLSLALVTARFAHGDPADISVLRATSVTV